jgi:hypothetical protein
MAYPTSPTVRPVIITFLFFIAAATRGTKGGEFIRETDEISTVSASSLNNLDSKSCIARDINIAKVM